MAGPGKYISDTFVLLSLLRRSLHDGAACGMEQAVVGPMLPGMPVPASDNNYIQVSLDQFGVLATVIERFDGVCYWAG